MSLAHTYLKQGRVEESVAHYEEAIELSRRSRYADGLAKSLRVFGDVLANLNRFDEALPYLEEAADCFHRLEDGKSEADTLIKIASIHEARKSAFEAEMIWQRIAGLLGPLDSYYELSAVEAFGRIARMRGNVPEALSHYLDAVELSVRAGDVEREGRLRNIAGIIEWQRGEFGEALLQYRKALELFDRCGDAAAAGLMLNSIGVTLQKLGNCEESIHHLRDALEVHEKSGRRQLKALALSALGDSYMTIHRHDDAKQAYADSLQIRWDINDRRGEGWMLHHLAVAHAAQGETDRSRDYARQAEVVGDEVKDVKLLDACRKLLG
jgi:tetratricopeptide (TPR) repeat protein